MRNIHATTAVLAATLLVMGGCGDKKKSEEDTVVDVEEEDTVVDTGTDVVDVEEEDVEVDTGCSTPPDCLNAPPDHETYGQPCTSDLDCGSGNTCIQERAHELGGEAYVAWMRGTCTRMGVDDSVCDPDVATSCPVGSRCAYLGRDSSGDQLYGCIDACSYIDTSWNPYDWSCGCREGYYCSPTAEACFPGCTNDRECCEVWNDMNGDLVRQPHEVFHSDTCENYCDGDDPDEFAGDGCQAMHDCINIGSDTATYHSECLFDSDCPADAYCRNEYNWLDDSGDPRYPGGICVKVRCELPGRGCEGSSGEDLGAECVNLNTSDDPIYYCWATCETGYGPEDGDLNPCRHDDADNPYTCWPLAEDRFPSGSTSDGYCLPAMVPTATTPAGMFEDCASDGTCASPMGLGICYIRMDNPGYCSARCSANLAQDSLICGAAPAAGEVPPGVCIFSYCRASCDTPHGALGANGCPRDDLACYPAGIYAEDPTFDPDGVAPAGICFPACDSDDDCNGFWSSPPYTCNTTDGTCFD